ncbi:Stealth CR1 domain-containing protein [Neorhizobium sp. DAR64860/K0K1]|uniref:Stealth CR1 domain-containing protein n=1 Tax=Neorhizobium sp. DAR64860/K0K1 TaxID=3421955 RepID=UPI003D26A181
MSEFVMFQRITRWFSSKTRRYAVLLRDELNQRYPITHLMLPAKQAGKWSRVLSNTVEGRPPQSVSQLLSSVDLGITRSFSGLKSDVDISAFSLPFLMSAMAKIAEGAGVRIFVHSNVSGWTHFNPSRFKASILKPGSSGRIELAVVDSGSALLSRHSITLWREQKGVAVAVGETTPVKRILVEKNWNPPQASLTPYKIEEIDAVYTWVNGSDPAWQELIRPYRGSAAIDPDRYSHNDELKHSIRSIELFAPWVRTIYIVSNCAPPDWFTESDRFKWVYHEALMPADILPTFNSHVIETFLHEISGLSEKFIYFNDDFFLSGFVRPQDFFNAYGQTVARLEPYGVLPYLEQLSDAGRAEEWQNAAVSGARLLDERTGIKPIQMHRHAPYAFTRTVFKEMIDEFGDEAATTRAARFRTADDISFASFFYHHYARSKGLCIESNEQSLIVRHTNFSAFQNKKMYRSLRFFCMNDGGGSSTHAAFNKFKTTFLASFYPFKSGCEK